MRPPSVLAAREESVDYAMSLIGDYLQLAQRSLHTATSDLRVRQDARAATG